jgi:hypothetical protein
MLGDASVIAVTSEHLVKGGAEVPAAHDVGARAIERVQQAAACAFEIVDPFASSVTLDRAIDSHSTLRRPAMRREISLSEKPERWQTMMTARVSTTDASYWHLRPARPVGVMRRPSRS